MRLATFRRKPVQMESIAAQGRRDPEASSGEQGENSRFRMKTRHVLTEISCCDTMGALFGRFIGYQGALDSSNRLQVLRDSHVDRAKFSSRSTCHQRLTVVD
jgi:hypothetical protein